MLTTLHRIPWLGTKLALMMMRAMERTKEEGGEINNVNFRSQLIERKGWTIHESSPTVLSGSC